MLKDDQLVPEIVDCYGVLVGICRETIQGAYTVCYKA